MRTRRYIDSDEDVIVDNTPAQTNPAYTMWLPLFLLVLVLLFGIWTLYPNRNGLNIQNNSAIPAENRPTGTQYGIGGGPENTTPTPTTYPLPSPTDTPKPTPKSMVEPSVSVSPSPTSILAP